MYFVAFCTLFFVYPPNTLFFLYPLFFHSYLSLKILSSLQLQTCPLIVFINVIFFYYRAFSCPSYTPHYLYKLNNIKNYLFSYNFLNYFYYLPSCTFLYILFTLIFVVISRCSRFVLLFKLPHFIFLPYFLTYYFFPLMSSLQLLTNVIIIYYALFINIF